MWYRNAIHELCELVKTICVKATRPTRPWRLYTKQPIVSSAILMESGPTRELYGDRSRMCNGEAERVSKAALVITLRLE